MGRWVLPAALLLSLPGGARAQELLGSSATFAAGPEAPQPSVDPLAASLRSLLVPGWGQLHLGQRRGWGYLLFEAVGWTVFAERTLAGGDVRDQYRDFAWEVARLRTAERRDGDFAYYEFMSKWSRSGAFDTEAARPGVQPEEDPTSFNGSIWALAQDIYIPPGSTPAEDDPAYQQALAYYMARAYGPDFLWDWSASPGAQGEFTELIHESDDRFRQATTALGAVLANHLISAVDAYLSGGAPRQARPVTVWAEPLGSGTRLSALVRIGVP